jgi:hypothetical protein
MWNEQRQCEPRLAVPQFLLFVLGLLRTLSALAKTFVG